MPKTTIAAPQPAAASTTARPWRTTWRVQPLASEQRERARGGRRVEQAGDGGAAVALRVGGEQRLGMAKNIALMSIR